MGRMDNNYAKPYGTWIVTTEGDCEGRSIKNLGKHEGYIDEIAFALADKCAYSLKFSKYVEPEKLDMVSKRKEVNIQLNIDSETWDMDSETRIKYFEELFNGRNVKVDKSNYYACVKIKIENNK